MVDPYGADMATSGRGTQSTGWRGHVLTLGQVQLVVRRPHHHALAHRRLHRHRPSAFVKTLVKNVPVFAMAPPREPVSPGSRIECQGSRICWRLEFLLLTDRE